ncbi:MAG TPA: transcription termination/antitermination NusG family protein [Bryobacteraceae bacterium]|nr:transcription termination/antitermination NusG family protein [Bryobacteraceae bacterium]
MNYQPDKEFPRSSHPWFAVRVKSNCERTVATLLDQRGYQQFIPACRMRTRWSDRVKLADRILFPGYVFCSFDPYDRLPVVSTPGVLHVVGVGKEPAAISGKEIRALWTAVRSGVPVSAWPYLQSGDWVVVERGALAGVEGIVTHFRGGYRLVVSIALLQRSIAAEIDREWVRPLRSTRSRKECGPTPEPRATQSEYRSGTLNLGW